jgi:prevent-host-death family protein
MILYMTTLSVADARANFSKLVESASTTHERFQVTRNGSRAAVLLGADDYDALVEMVDILADSEAVAAIRDGLRDVEVGQLASADEVREAMIEAGRLPE